MEVDRLTALRDITPQPLAQKILAARQQVEGARKQVTVVFTDIVGSTTHAEKMDPEQWFGIVNGAFEAMTQVVYTYEGTVAQLMGDGMLCFFGAPISHEDDPERAVRAARALVAAIQTYAQQIAQTHGIPSFQVRVGINTGLVIVGSVGSSLHFEYTVIGDTVNLAARIQSAAEPDGVFVTQNTQRLLRGVFEFEDRGEFTLKGKTLPVRVYKVLGEKKGAPQRRGLSGLVSPMVGRERELATLQRLTQELRDGRGSIVTIIGEAGLGKTRLKSEWRTWVQTEPEAPRVVWVEGHCLAYGVSMAFQLVINLVRSFIGVPPGSSDADTQAALRHTLETRLGADAETSAEVYPYLAHLLSLPLDNAMAERVKYLDAGALQTQYSNALRRGLQRVTQQRPALIVCEDSHWADPQSVQVLSRFLPLAAELPLLFCFLTRPDYDAPGWKLATQARALPGVGALELHLAALSENDSQQLVANLLEGAPLAAAVQRLILAKAEGNPFFTEEVVRILIERGGIARAEGKWVATDKLQQIEIPDTLQGLLLARVDQLPDDVRRTLQVAAVIGREFSVQVLAKVLERQARKAPSICS